MKATVKRSYVGQITNIEVCVVPEGKDNAGERFLKVTYMDASVNLLLARATLQGKVCIFDLRPENIAVFEQLIAKAAESGATMTSVLANVGLDKIALVDNIVDDMEPVVPVYAETKSYANGTKTEKGKPVLYADGTPNIKDHLNLTTVVDPTWGIIQDAVVTADRMINDRDFFIKASSLGITAAEQTADAETPAVVAPPVVAPAPAV